MPTADQFRLADLGYQANEAWERWVKARNAFQTENPATLEEAYLVGWIESENATREQLRVAVAQPYVHPLVEKFFPSAVSELDEQPC